MKQNVLRKLIREEINKVLQEYTTPYYQPYTMKKSDLPKELQYHGDMMCLKGKLIDVYWSEEERTAYVCSPGSHKFHAFRCGNPNELEALVMRYDKVQADAADDFYDKSKTHTLTKEN
jgi:hypothetical protein